MMTCYSINKDFICQTSTSVFDLTSTNYKTDYTNYYAIADLTKKKENGSANQDVDGIRMINEKALKIQLINQFKKDILSTIANDNFESGTISDSERFIANLSNHDNLEYIRQSANLLYLTYYDNPHILTGLLIMMSSLSYENALEQGPTMALGLLQHKNIEVRDRAIQAFERWNSKKGIPILKSLHCDQHWLQTYVNKVIFYLERDGID